VAEDEQLDVANESQHRPGALAEHGAGDVVRLRNERVAGSHALRGHSLHAAEKLLVLKLLVGEAHQGLEGSLVAEPVLAADLDDLGPDEALDQAEHVGVGAPLNLAHQPFLVAAKEIHTVDFRQPVGQELLAEIEAAAADHVAVDFPADALRELYALGVAFACLRVFHDGLRV